MSIVNDQTPSLFILRQADSLFLPYGNFPHQQGLQKFDRASAAYVQANFAAAPNIPAYAGHPDVPGRPDSNPSAPALGWVGGISIGNDGATLAMKWSPEGRRAIQGARYRFYLPYWDLRKVPGGIQPVKLRSIGLTNSPRIPVPSISNDDDQIAAQLASEKEELRRRLGRVTDATFETNGAQIVRKTDGLR